MFHLVDWENRGKWLALGGSRFTHSENKVGKLVKTSGIFFVGRYQVMEVIYSSGNLFWRMFLSGLFQYNFFSGLFGRRIRLQLAGTSYSNVDWIAAPTQCREPRFLFILFLCVSWTAHQCNTLCLALPSHSVESWSFLSITDDQGFLNHLTSQQRCPGMHWCALLGCWAWLVGRRRRHHSEACMDYLHLPAAAPSSLKGESTIACFTEGFTLQKYT